jgi:hypothetical protein
MDFLLFPYFNFKCSPGPNLWKTLCSVPSKCSIKKNILSCSSTTWFGMKTTNVGRSEALVPQKCYSCPRMCNNTRGQGWTVNHCMRGITILFLRIVVDAWVYCSFGSLQRVQTPNTETMYHMHVRKLHDDPQNFHLHSTKLDPCTIL